MGTLRRWVKSLLYAIEPAAMKLAIRSKFLTNLYYLFDDSFSREHRAVIAGKLKHLREMNSARSEGGRFKLRRNVHRLEKGLIMKPRRPVFAKDYIGETADLYATLVSGQTCDRMDDPLVQWAGDVLGEYFEAVAPEQDDKVDRARGVFQKAFDACRGERGDVAPYHRPTEPLSIDYEDMLELAKRRRSVRWYQQKPVPRGIIDRALVVGGFGPSACNRQPYRFRIFDNPEDAQRIGKIPMGTAGFSSNFPCLVVVTGVLSAYRYERDRHVIYIDAALASMGFLFALEAQGIGSCCINWPDIPGRERMMAREIGVEPDERVIMCISLGYPDETGRVPFSQKKSLDEIRTYEGKGQAAAVAADGSSAAAQNGQAATLSAVTG